ncbi:MAG: DNA repair protein RecO [Clostridiales bacterium]
MKFEKLKGIVIKETNTNEADKILTLLTDIKGKVAVFAKGARRPRSSLGLSSQLLCYSEFVLFKGRDFYYLSSAELIKHFYFIRKDIIKVTYCAHVLEICRDGTQENQYSEDILRLLLNTLYIIENPNKKSYDLIISIFEFKFISLMGFTPNVYQCNNCGKSNIDRLYFDVRHNNLVCKNCSISIKNNIIISLPTLKSMIYILEAPIQSIFKVNLLNQLTKELKTFTSKYLNYVMEKNYNKLNMLKDLL